MTPDLLTRYQSLNSDEQRVVRWVLDQVIRGLENGRSVYGPLHLASDSRNFTREAGEELRDGLVYLACASLDDCD